MKTIDLTHMMKPDMQVYPGTEQPVFEKAMLLERDGARETKFHLYSHTGTHMDAPAHMLDGAPYLDELDAESFVGRAVKLDLSMLATEFIELEHIKSFEKKISNADFVIINTGNYKNWGSDDYFNYPVMTAEAAKWLAGFNLKGIAADVISVDKITSTEYEVHKVFLEKNMVIIENLTNLGSINDEFFLLSVLPLKYLLSDGSPVRAVAIEGIL